MTGAQIAKRFGVSTKTVTNDWAKDGCPRNPDKSFDLDKVVAWRKAKLQSASDDPGVRMQANKTALQSKRLLLQCEMLEVGLLREKGKLHDSHACALSLTAIVSEAMQPLMSLHSQVKAAFPELPPNVIEVIAAKVDAAMEQMREGLK
jgi:phage terminase Nu1 subunit (DNA packaging protein)